MVKNCFDLFLIIDLLDLEYKKNYTIFNIFVKLWCFDCLFSGAYYLYIILNMIIK